MKYPAICLLMFAVNFSIDCGGQNKTVAATATIRQEDVVMAVAPDHITRTIIQDRRGNIWFATFGGVFRYDGKSFTHVTSAVSAARFFSVLEDRKGNLWFSTVGEGVYQYDGISFRHFTVADGLANNRVIDIYEDDSGNIWFGTDSGPSKYNGRSFQNYQLNLARDLDLGITPVTFDSVDTWGGSNKSLSPFGNKTRKTIPNEEVNTIIRDKSGSYWLGTRGNAYLFDGKAFNSFPHGASFTNVRKVIEDKRGNVWLGGSDGLWRYDGSNYVKLTSDFVGYIYEDWKGNIWTSSQTADGWWALSRYDVKSLAADKPAVMAIKSRREGMPGMIFGILEARDGSIWYGALDGAYRYDRNTITHFRSATTEK